MPCHWSLRAYLMAEARLESSLLPGASSSLLHCRVIAVETSGKNCVFVLAEVKAVFILLYCLSSGGKQLC